MNDELNLLPQSDFPAKVWRDFGSIDLTDYIKVLKHANNAKYISWSDCWSLICDRYPYSTKKFWTEVLENKSVMVWCSLTISNGEDRWEQQQFLPVMGPKNEAIFDPSARAISDTMQRCLAKAAANFNLGLWLYSGEDVPRLEAAPNILTGNINTDQIVEICDLIRNSESDEAAFLKFFNVDVIENLPAAKFKNAKALLEAKLKKMGDKK